jgi:anti-sigma regulatory factor (Ser/Thr protein kinase)
MLACSDVGPAQGHGGHHAAGEVNGSISQDERRLTLPAEPTSVSRARRLVSTALTAWDLDHLTDEVVLLTSELVTNAVIHARTPFEVALSVSDQVLRVVVADGSPAVPLRKSYGATATTGRGLELVETIARQWGTEPREAGKVVWFEISTPCAEETAADGPTPAPSSAAPDLDALEAALLGDLATEVDPKLDPGRSNDDSGGDDP